MIRFLNRRLFAVIIALLVLLIAVVGSWQAHQARAESQANVRVRRPPAKYVFLFIGDGMAAPQIAAAELYLKQTGQGRGLKFTQLNTKTLTRTHSATHLVTDSAAAGTALACGKKTANGVLGMDSDRKQPYANLGELAKQTGRKLGIVSSVSIDHATPAAFYAHSPSRNQYYDIAMQMTTSGVDYFGGGQAKGNKPKYRKGRTDILQAMRQADYKIVSDQQQLLQLESGTGKVWAFATQVDNAAALPYEMDRADDQPTLADFTRAGIQLLDNPKGFFMMVEAGKIDWACHANDTAAMVEDLKAFDDAINVALEFAKTHPGEVLIVVTGDHECGGLILGAPTANGQLHLNRLANQQGSGQRHPSQIAALQQNNAEDQAVLQWAQSTFGLNDLSESEQAFLLAAYHGKLSKPQADGYGDANHFAAACRRLLTTRAGLIWATAGHTGVPVVTFAQGPGAEYIAETDDNTEIFNALLSAMQDQQNAEKIKQFNE